MKINKKNGEIKWNCIDHSDSYSHSFKNIRSNYILLIVYVTYNNYVTNSFRIMASFSEWMK